MTKEEKIKEAYKEYFNAEKINENGWTNEATSDILNNIPCDAKEMHIVYGQPEWWYRPKSLAGIENNNGWTTLDKETYENLENGYYMWYNNENGDWEIDDLSDTHLENYTHFQEITVPPKPPIY